MYRLMMKHVLLMWLLVASLVFAMSACGGNEQPISKPQPLPEERQALRTGVYRSEEFEPSLSFRVGEGWTTDPPEASDVLRITWGETGGLGFANVQEVYEPTSTGTPSVVEAPEDMVGWFRQHPYLQTSEPEPVTVGGAKGVRFDVVGEDLPEGYRGVCGTDCMDLARFSDGSRLFHPKGTKVRLIVLEDMKGETVTMGFGSPAAEFDEHAPEAQEVIDTVEWRGS
jgi:hypothetical protein